MLSGDLASSTIASHCPDIAGACDSPRDLLAEPFLLFDGPLPRTHDEFQKVTLALLDSGLAEIPELAVAEHFSHDDAFSGGVKVLPLRATDKTAAESGCADHTPRTADHTTRDALIRVLQLLTGGTDYRLAMKATCMLRLIGHEPRSLEQIGKEFGVGRAAIHACYRSIQRRAPQFRSAADKSESTREACRKRRLGKKKTAKNAWPAFSLWKRPLLLPSPL